MGIPWTPIIALTVRMTAADKEKMAAVLMDDAIRKPLGREVLIEKVLMWGRLGLGATGGEMRLFLDTISSGLGAAKPDFIAKL
jgi:hypothetical protein